MLECAIAAGEQRTEPKRRGWYDGSEEDEPSGGGAVKRMAAGIFGIVEFRRELACVACRRHGTACLLAPVV